MPIKIKNELLAINILTILLVVIVYLVPSNPLRLILGLPVLLLFPGYALTAALFPRKDDVGGLERGALSFGLSLAAVALIGIVVNPTLGLELWAILVSVTAFILAASAVAWHRRRRLPEEERFAISFTINVRQWAGMGRWDKALSVLLVVSVLGAIGTLGYAIAIPKAPEPFTEFYLVGAEYPEELVVEEEGRVTLAIANYEGEQVSYRVEITIDGELNNEAGPVSLAHEGTWEEEVGFVPHKTGDDQKVEFLLYKEDGGEPYRSFYFWLDVTAE